MSDADKQLVEQILQGQRQAIEQFYYQYLPLVRGMVRRKISSPEDCEEVVQDVFISAIKSIGTFSYQAKLSTWLASITRHEIADYYRRRKLKLLLWSHFPQLETWLGKQSQPDMVERYALQEKINQVMASLLPRYAQLLKLKYDQGLSVKEIAQQLGISFKAAEAGLFRARKAFALSWQDEDPG